jgi:uncharacterized protein YegL
MELSRIISNFRGQKSRLTDRVATTEHARVLQPEATMNSIIDADFDAIELASTADPRCACILVLDTSGSMAGDRIAELNAGLAQLQRELHADTLARRRVEIATVTFGQGGLQEHDFVLADRYIAPTLVAGGNTPMGGGICRAIQLLRDRKAVYRAHGLAVYRPWFVVMTDGVPTDDWLAAAEQLRAAEAGNELIAFAIGIGDANFEVLRKCSPGRPPLRLKGHSFREFFLWLSASMKGVSGSMVGDKMRLLAFDGWGEVPT